MQTKFVIENSEQDERKSTITFDCVRRKINQRKKHGNLREEYRPSRTNDVCYISSNTHSHDLSFAFFLLARSLLLYFVFFA